MKRAVFLMPLTVLPACLLLAELAFQTAMNVRDALSPSMQALPKDGLPVSPEFAFSWIQAATGGGMWLILAWSVWRGVGLLRGKTKLNTSSIMALAILLTFAAPSIGLWFWTIGDLLQGRFTVDLSNPAYAVSAFCQPFLLLLAVAAWRTAYTTQHHSTHFLSD
ncbi:MAG: hypothetical protein Q4B82_00625 [Alysiella sp.]|uniref:hypothetical protein n=1 Tax=Alysiella sp. TaxID=1872483 RepID=UPI0026DD8BD3|nr:hypothetical protein [Alysiella sp.]MDO4433071.1 hypothetical protein [Alysiella sp.]